MRSSLYIKKHRRRLIVLLVKYEILIDQQFKSNIVPVKLKVVCPYHDSIGISDEYLGKGKVFGKPILNEDDLQQNKYNKKK